MSFRNSLPFVLFLAACTAGDHTSTKGQMITCTTDPGTGVILRCTPEQHPTPTGSTEGSGSGSGSGSDGSGSGSDGSGSGSGSGTGTCTDVDEDGDGEPHDTGVIAHEAQPGDADGDGVPDADDCDNHPGEDDGGDGGVDLPYDIHPQLGQTSTPVVDAFLEKGTVVPTILSVTMDGGNWRLTELQASTPFVITQDDCDHVGNRDIGRDRVVVTWQNTDGTTSADHLDIRYCN